MTNVDGIRELLLMCLRVRRIEANVSEIAMNAINCIDGYNICYAFLSTSLQLGTARPRTRGLCAGTGMGGAQPSMDNYVLTLDIYTYYY